MAPAATALVLPISTLLPLSGAARSPPANRFFCDADPHSGGRRCFACGFLAASSAAVASHQTNCPRYVPIMAGLGSATRAGALGWARLVDVDPELCRPRRLINTDILHHAPASRRWHRHTPQFCVSFFVTSTML
jgi:hypothetical protein